MSDDMSRRRYTRLDLAQLKTLDAPAVYRVLGTFDDRGMDPDVLVLQTCLLLAPERIPGLAAATRRGNAAAAAHAVWDAARAHALSSPPPAKPPTRSDGQNRVADDILKHRLTFYQETHPLPDSIDWNHNPGTAHWGHDLNRFSYLYSLQVAARATGDLRYARKVVDLIIDWIDKNPFSQAFVGTPYAFGSYLNQAIHIRAWCETLDRLLTMDQAADVLSPIELLRILKSLQEHLAYLEIVTGGHHGNWPTIGCMGMLSALAAMPLLRETGRFVDYAIDTLDEQIQAQILPDGVQDELTPHYHQVVINNITGAATSLQRLERGLRPSTLATLGRMAHYAMQIVTPDGSARVAFNDSDPNSVQDIRDTFAGLGLERLLTSEADLGPERFPYAGVALLRQKPDEGDLYLAFDGGPFGRAHQHEDKLGFWLFAYGRSFLVDPGRHLYDQGPKSFRPYLVSTQAHNTITVDGLGQNSRGRRDTWIAREPVDLAWSVKPGELRAAAAYDLGYGPENTLRVDHHREIVFVDSRFWVIFDNVTCDMVARDDAHDIASRFQFAPSQVIAHGAGFRTTYDDSNLLVLPLSDAAFDAHVAVGERSPTAGWFSPSYGLIEPAPQLILTWKTLLPLTAAVLLLPYRGAQPPNVTADWHNGELTVTMDDKTRSIRPTGNRARDADQRRAHEPSPRS